MANLIQLETGDIMLQESSTGLLQETVANAVTWTNTNSATTVSSPDIYRNDHTADYKATTNETISPDALSYFEFGVISPNSDIAVHLVPVSGGPYNYRIATMTAGMRSSSDSVTTGVRTAAGYQSSSEVAYNPADRLRYGFDGSNHLQFWVNGTVIWTDTVTTTTEAYELFIFTGFYDTNVSGGLTKVIHS